MQVSGLCSLRLPNRVVVVHKDEACDSPRPVQMCAGLIYPRLNIMRNLLSTDYLADDANQTHSACPGHLKERERE